jgi:hypothetical protein
LVVPHKLALDAFLRREAPDQLTAPVYTKGPIAPAWSWTGIYVGGNLGAGLGTNSWLNLQNLPGGLKPASTRSSAEPQVKKPRGHCCGGA